MEKWGLQKWGFGGGAMMARSGQLDIDDEKERGFKEVL